MYIVDLKKKIKELTEELNNLTNDRSRNSTFKYTMEEKSSGNLIKPSTSLENYTISIQNLHEELLRLKSKLRKANETVCDNGNSIIENITELKQLTAVEDLTNILGTQVLSQATVQAIAAGAVAHVPGHTREEKEAAVAAGPDLDT